MRFIALLFLLAICQCKSEKCISFPNGVKCSQVSNDDLFEYSQKHVSIDNGDLEIDEKFLGRFPNASFFNFEETIVSFHDSTNKNHPLKSLWIVDCDVTHFKRSLEHFHELEEVKVSYSNTDYHIFDKEFFENNNHLKVLKLIHSNLQSIESNAFDNLLDLSYVEITETALSVLPENVFKFNDKLEYLVLSKNTFKSFPEILYPKQLLVLKLDHNLITQIPKTDSLILGNLTDLVLNGNQIESIDEDAFDNLTSIKYLSLAHNYLVNVSARHFQNLENIETLDLSYNLLDPKNLVDIGVSVMSHGNSDGDSEDEASSGEELALKDDEELNTMYWAAVYPDNYNDEDVIYVYPDYDTPTVIEESRPQPQEEPVTHSPRKFESDDEELGESGSGRDDDEDGHQSSVTQYPEAEFSGCEGFIGLKISFLIGLIVFARVF